MSFKREMDHTPRKRFGQNFLKDTFIIQSILDSVSVPPTLPSSTSAPETHMVEIGPGLGALTHGLIPLADFFTAIEIDRDLVAKFNVQFNPAQHPKVKIVLADALKFDFTQLTPKPFRLVGNLPYNISTPLLIHLFQQIESIQDMHFMLQKEVVDRLAAAPDSKDYGRLSVIAQYFCDVLPLIEIPPESFYPAPKVNSAFVRLTPRPNRPPLPFELFETVVREAFHCRRKTLANNLKSFASKETLTSWGFNPSARAETLSVEEFVRLAEKIGATSDATPPRILHLPK
jgi:16S rRNA (adenine1518-N6/adenine1519-N6)-dimethyltransferase